MIKNTGTRTVETTNFVQYRAGLEVASHRWTTAEKTCVAGGPEEIIDRYSEAYLASDLDAHGYKVDVQVWEYNLPGLRVVVLASNGTVETVFSISDDTVNRLHKAVRMERPVTITYRTSDGGETVRTVEPRTLRVSKSGSVFMTSLDRETGEYRSWTVAKVLAYTVHRTARLVEPPVKVADNLTGEIKTISARRYRALIEARDPLTVDEAVLGFLRYPPEAGTEADGEFMKALDRVALTR